jgi:hypothetical protein
MKHYHGANEKQTIVIEKVEIHYHYEQQTSKDNKKKDHTIAVEVIKGIVVLVAAIITALATIIVAVMS